MALGSIGIRPEKSFCLNLPFYRNTMKSNRAITEKDEEIVKSLMRLIEPTVIYAAGIFIIIQVTLLTLTGLIESAFSCF